jgi:hypothetical protein
MKTSRFSDSQILAMLKQAEAGTQVPEICREQGISLILPRFHRHPVKRLFSDPEESYENEQT